MGLQDRDYWRDAHRNRKNLAELDRQLQAASRRSAARSYLKFAVIWLVVIGCLYFAFSSYTSPPQAIVSATGELHIPRARDGHFYVQGTVNGRPVRFLVDTGASKVMVSEEFARAAGLQGGTPTTFHTANGAVQGRTVHHIPVEAGPVALSSTSVGVGLVGGPADGALLGQTFLSRFNVAISSDRMVLTRP